MAEGESFNIDFGKLKVGKRIGKGAVGSVHTACVEVAVKKLKDPDKTVLDREFTQLLKLDHPNIIKLYGVSRERKNVFIVMELAENGSLFDALYNSAHKPTLYQAIDWGKQCASGVAYLHDQDIVHRDLKPENCLLFNDCQTLKICDFSIARKLADPFQSIMTQGVGTPPYMAPEVIEDDEYTEKCDVYSWALMMWELITLKRPFSGQSTKLMVKAKRRGETPPLLRMKVLGDASIKCKMNSLLKKCWAKNPSRRPTMDEVYEDMLDLNDQISDLQDRMSSSSIDF